MHFSISSLLISLVLASLLIVLLQILLSQKFNYRFFRIDFLQIFALIIFIRLAVPFEFINTHTLSSHIILPVLYKTAQHPLLNSGITFAKLLLIIWFTGTLFSLFHFIKSLCHVKQISSMFNELPANYLSKQAINLIPSSVTLNYLNIPKSPFVYGTFHPHIVFCALESTPEEQVYIIKHELQHIRNHDILKKHFVNILVCIYWWFPLIYLFQKQINIIFEMEADHRVVNKSMQDVYFNYVQSLVHITKSLTSISDPLVEIDNSTFANFTILENCTLKQRVQFLLEGYEIRSTKPVIKMLLILIPLLITSIIFEPDSTNLKAVSGTKTINQTSYVIHKSSKYYLIIDGKNMGSFESLKNIQDPEIKKLPVFEK